MGLFGSKKHVELERIISRLESNKQNNYKDAAQQDFKELAERFSGLLEAGKLSEKQKSYYESVLSSYGVTMKGYTHKDQKPFWT